MVNDREVNAIWSGMARAALELSATGGLDVDALVTGLSFDARSVRRMRMVPWDDYCTLVERMEVACGGPEAIDELLLRQYHTSWPPELRRVFAAVVSPKLLIRSVISLMTPRLMPSVDHTIEELPDGRLRLTGRLRDGCRGCFTYFRGSVSAFRNMPCHLGLPPAECDVEELSDRSYVLALRLPPSRTLLAQAREISGAFARWASDHVIGQLSADLTDRDAQLADIGALGRELARHIDLPSLADAIVGMLVKLGWARVALHVVPVGQSACVPLRSHGPENVPITAVLPLRISEHDVGRLEVGGAGSAKLLHELLPWLSISVDNARTFAAVLQQRSRADGPSQERLAALQERLSLTPRQAEVYGLVLRGLSNKEIAVELACAESTVEFHLTQVLRKAGVDSRTQLIARFWAEA
jgi:DNA-binding CsgD family transcriptional regulator